MDLLIREATPDDYEGLCAVFSCVDALHREALPRTFQRPEGPFRTRAYFTAIIADEDTGLFVAERGERIVGLVHILIRETPALPIMVPCRFAEIDAVAVLEGERRSGVGRELVERAQEWAQTRGVDRIELLVWEFNQGAIAFYEKLGYTTALRRMRKPLE